MWAMQPKKLLKGLGVVVSFFQWMFDTRLHLFLWVNSTPLQLPGGDKRLANFSHFSLLTGEGVYLLMWEHYFLSICASLPPHLPAKQGMEREALLAWAVSPCREAVGPSSTCLRALSDACHYPPSEQSGKCKEGGTTRLDNLPVKESCQA